MDGASQGPAHFNTSWIRVTGPEETREFPGQLVVATDYFHPLFFHTDNDGFAELTATFGMPMTRASSMTFGPPGPGVQTGSATDDGRDPPLAYAWSTDNVLVNEVPVVVVHVLHGVDDRGEPLSYDIECPIEAPFFAPTLGSVEFEPGSELEDLFGTGFEARAGSLDLNCAVELTRGAEGGP